MRILVTLDDGESITFEVKPGEVKAAVDDITSRGISTSDQDFTYYYPAHRVRVVRVPRER